MTAREEIMDAGRKFLKEWASALCRAQQLMLLTDAIDTHLYAADLANADLVILMSWEIQLSTESRLGRWVFDQSGFFEASLSIDGSNQ
jgi:hypothetical protein